MPRSCSFLVVRSPMHRKAVGMATNYTGFPRCSMKLFSHVKTYLGGDLILKCCVLQRSLKVGHPAQYKGISKRNNKRSNDITTVESTI